MNILKKTSILLFLMIFITSFMAVKIVAKDDYIPLEKANGSGYVTYRNSSVQVTIPTTYTYQESEFRAVWVSPLVGDVMSYLNDDLYKNELTSVLNIVQIYNINAIVFHLRIMNDALYDSDLNIRSNYISGADFSRWDYLEWFIGECHRRGIEFHAWLNPYRISSSSTSLSFVTSKYAKYPQNPASKAENIIIGNSGAILNPGEPAVRNFVVDTCMEIIEKYDVDAIHFDDYFYASMPTNADINTYNKYKANSTTTNISDWRREQVDLFIKKLSTTMRAYNKANNRAVQLGIAPTGIWRNGNGVVNYDANGTAITSGSNTAGQEHYASYLFCNTKKWVDEEWIDYIIPQSYWSFELNAAPYADVVDWWAKVVAYKNVNLYTGMGYYRLFSGDSGGSWETNPYEASNQVLYNTKHDEIQGVCIFNYKYLKDSRFNLGMAKVIDEYWNYPVITPVIRTMDPIYPSSVANPKVIKISEDNYVLKWQPAQNARKYIIYAHDGVVDTTDPRQVVDVVGVNSNGECLALLQANANTNYALVAVSGTGHQSSPTLTSSKNAISEDIKIASFEAIEIKTNIFPQENVQISFSLESLYVGDLLEYGIYYSYDQTNWFELDGRIRQYNNVYNFYFDYPDSLSPMYIKVIGTNQVGKLESTIIELKISINSPNDILYLAKELINRMVDFIFPTP